MTKRRENVNVHVVLLSISGAHSFGTGGLEDQWKLKPQNFMSLLLLLGREREREEREKSIL